MEPAAQPAGDVVAELPADVEEQRIAVERLPVIQAKATEATAFVAVQRDDGRLDDRDAECLHSRELIRIEAVRTVAEQDDVVGPLAQQDGEVFAAAAGGEDGEPLVAVLEAVAVRAGVRAGPPDLGEAWNIGQLVEHAGGEEQGPRQVRAAGRGDADGAVERLGFLDLGRHDLDAVAAEFCPAAGAQVGRIEAVVAEHAVHLVRGVVARPGAVERPGRVGERGRARARR